MPLHVMSVTETIDRRERRRRVVLDVARRLFLEHGYDAVSLGEIVRCSGGSLSTIYDLFESKLGLLGAIMADQRFGGVERLDAIITSGLPPPEMLAELADALAGEMANDEMLRLIRLVTEQMRNDPAFARQVFESAHLPVVDRLRRLFIAWQQGGHADIANVETAVFNFFALVTHRGLARALFGADCEDRMPLLERQLDDAVALFIRGYAIR
jgi:TetR/AcrR family transcriptional repressor of mexJK operon